MPSFQSLGSGKLPIWALLLLASTSFLGIVGASNGFLSSVENAFLIDGKGVSPQALEFKSLTMADGLTSNEITTVFQDRDGFIWIGTGYGINLFDGYEATSFLPDASDSNNPNAGFSGGKVNEFIQSGDGRVWIAASTGLHVFEPDSGAIRNFSSLPDAPPAAHALLEAKDGGIWIGAGDIHLSSTGSIRSGHGLYHFDPLTETFTRYAHMSGATNGLISNGIWDILENGDGSLWLATGTDPIPQRQTNSGRPAAGQTTNARRSTRGNNGTLTRFFPAQSRFVNYPVPEITGWPLAVFTTLEVSDDGVIWAAGDRAGGIYALDSETAELRAGYSLTYANEFVSDLQFFSDGSLWVATNHRVAQIKEDSRAIETVSFSVSGSLNAGLPAYACVFEDQSEVIWIGTGTNGLLNVNPKAPRINRLQIPDQRGIAWSSAPVLAITEDRLGSIWVGTDIGLVRMDSGGERTTYFSHEPGRAASLRNNRIFHLAEDSTGQIWVATEGGIDRVNARNPARFTHVTHQSLGLDMETDPVARTISVDRSGNVWLGLDTRGGLIRIDRATGDAVLYTHNPEDPESLGFGTVSTVFEDETGRIWIAGWEMGVSEFIPHRNSFRHLAAVYALDAGPFRRDVNGLVPDPVEPGILWASTQGAGLLRIDTQSGRVADFNLENGLFPTNLIFSLQRDQNGELWSQSNRGVVRFDPKTFRTAVFDTRNGLVDLFAYALSSAATRDGRILFGQSRGLVWLNPEDMMGSSIEPNIQITSIHVNDVPIGQMEPSPSARSVSRTTSISLPHHQNNLTIGYVALHFGYPAGNKYRIRLENYDRNWREMGNQRVASYTNLSPGTYTFRVIGSNSDGLWNDEGKRLTIEIRAPWWLTYWAFGTYIFLIVFGIIAFDLLLRRKVERKERESARQRELKQAREIERAYTQLKTAQSRLVQAEKMASLGQLTAGIAHEIKNPLNFINNFADLNAELAEELIEALEKNDLDLVRELVTDITGNDAIISEHGHRADRIIHSMMQHASGGTGHLQLTDVNTLVSEYVDLAWHGKRAQTPGFDVILKRDFSPDTGKISLVPQDIGRVILNLVGNAFYAVEQWKKANPGFTAVVEIVTGRDENGVFIRVSDNGGGMTPEVSQRIFEPFFTTKPAGMGTGLGLSLSFDIVANGHGGTLEVETAEGKSTTFTITLPDSPETNPGVSIS